MAGIHHMNSLVKSGVSQGLVTTHCRTFCLWSLQGVSESLRAAQID